MRFNYSYHATLPPLVIVKEHLEQRSIAYTEQEDGAIELASDIEPEHLEELQDSLRRYSIEVLDDEKSRLVQRIKNLLLDLVYDDKPQQQTMSAYLTEKLGYSYGYISGIFAQYTLTSIERHLIMLKIERAKRLIIEDEYSLKEISNILSYSSVGHFSKQFKKKTGMTISTFKKIIMMRRKSNLG